MTGDPLLFFTVIAIMVATVYLIIYGPPTDGNDWKDEL
jgi:hypothetical protein